MQKYKHVFATCLLVTSLSVSTESLAEIVDGVPTPPKRPDVMSVSPAYIEYLKNKTKGIEYTPSPSAKSEEKEKSQPQKQRDTVIGSQAALKNIDANGVLSVLSGNKILLQTPPLPKRKPITLSSAKHMNGLNTHAGTEPETTLVSFTIEPGKIQINEDIEGFLENHALRLFNDNKSMTMQIHAYATPVDNAEYSDVRLSLARALEVRSFLIKHDIDPTRLKLSPMGVDNKNNSDDRIDLLFIAPQN